MVCICRDVELVAEQPTFSRRSTRPIASITQHLLFYPLDLYMLLTVILLLFASPRQLNPHIPLRPRCTLLLIFPVHDASSRSLFAPLSLLCISLLCACAPSCLHVPTSREFLFMKYIEFYESFMPPSPLLVSSSLFLLILFTPFDLFSKMAGLLVDLSLSILP